jgi:predicted O-methyltransferase YrrM
MGDSLMISQLSWDDLRALYDFPLTPPDWPVYVPGPESLQPGEFRVLMGLLNHYHVETILEIGIAEGHVARGVLAGLPNIKRYVGMDVPSTFDLLQPIDYECPGAIKGHKSLDDSRFALVLLSGGTQTAAGLLAPEQFDCVIVDADHTQEGVTRDAALACELVRPGGLVVFHDIEVHPGVKKFCEDSPVDVMAAGNIGWRVVE